jgi:hypothetical protein
VGHSKAVLRGNLIAINDHIRKLEGSQINNLMMHLNLLEKQKWGNPKSNRYRDYKNQWKTQWIGEQKNVTMNQWKKKLVLWKNKQDWQTFSQIY